MRFSLPAVAAALIPIAQGREIALESSVHISPVEMLKLGEVRVNASGVAAWVPTPGIIVPVTGLDLHLRADDSLADLSGLPTVTLDVTLDGVVGASTAVAAFTVPSWVADQTNTFPLGQSSDFVGQGAGNSARLITAVDGLNTSANLPANTTFSVWGSPAAEKFVFHGFKRSVDGPYTTPKFVEIADGYNPAASVKKGRAESSSLKIDMVHLSSMGGITRYNGSRVAVAVKIVKNKAVQTEWVVYTGYGISAQVNRGDGDDEVIESSTGPFETFFNFVAP